MTKNKKPTLAERMAQEAKDKAKRLEAAAVESEIEDELASDVVMEKKLWLWRDHLLMGAATILTGPSTVGKGQVLCYLARVVTRPGSRWPDGQPGPEEAGYVIMIGSEDMKKQELKPRLIAAGADPNRVIFLKGVRKDKRTNHFVLDDVDKLEQRILHHLSNGRNIKLVTIDPITSYVSRKTNNNQTVEVRAQLTPLVDMLERLQIACCMVTHPAKAAGANSHDWYSGAGAYIQVARIAELCIPEYDADGVATGRALLAMVATNAGKKQPTLAYRIEAKHVIGDDPEKDTHPYVVWEGQVDVSADQAVYRQKHHFSGGGASEGGSRDLIAAHILDQLRDGPAPAKAITNDCMRLFGVSDNTVWRVAKKMNVATRKDNGVNGGWIWTHPDFPGQKEMELRAKAKQHI